MMLSHRTFNRLLVIANNARAESMQLAFKSVYLAVLRACQTGEFMCAYSLDRIAPWHQGVGDTLTSLGFGVTMSEKWMIISW